MRRAVLCIAVLCSSVLFFARAAQAHDAPARLETGRAGPYLLEIAIYDARPNVLRPLRVAVRELPGSAGLEGAAVTVQGIPGPETDAVPTRPISLRPAADVAGGLNGAVLLSVLGGWDLEVRAHGPSGIGVVRIPVAVTAPWVVPEWMGWAVGLSPLLGLAWFAWWQRGYLRHLDQHAG